MSTQTPDTNFSWYNILQSVIETESICRRSCFFNELVNVCSKDHNWKVVSLLFGVPNPEKTYSRTVGSARKSQIITYAIIVVSGQMILMAQEIGSKMI